MISDSETNFVYISDLFHQKAPQTFQELIHKFDKLGIKYAELANTKDLWVVDFMPIQTQKDGFKQFIYDPDYLKPKKYMPLWTNSKTVCDSIGLDPKPINIVLDGGNIVKGKTEAILTTKVFKENPLCQETDLISEIKNELQVKQIIVIPQEPRDPVGHSDGMVRFGDDNKVFVNQYPKNKDYEDFAYCLRWSIGNLGLQCIDFPYTSWKNDDPYDATGCYINFLEIGKYIFYPVFMDSENDELILKCLHQGFKDDREFIKIDCRELAKLGGVLNCATWNIKK